MLLVQNCNSVRIRIIYFQPIPDLSIVSNVLSFSLTNARTSSCGVCADRACHKHDKARNCRLAAFIFTGSRDIGLNKSTATIITEAVIVLRCACKVQQAFGSEHVTFRQVPVTLVGLSHLRGHH